MKNAGTVCIVVNDLKYLYTHRSELVSELSQLYQRILIVSPDSDEKYKLAFPNAELHFIPVNFKTTVVSFLSTLVAFLILLKRENVTLIHAVSTKAIFLSAISSKFLLRKKLICSISGLGILEKYFSGHAYQSKIIYIIWKFLIPERLSYYIVQNSKDRSILLQLVRNDERILQTYGSGVDLDYFSPIARRDHDDERFTFFMASRLLSSKGIIEYQDAAEIIQSKFPNSLFLLAGGYDCKNPSTISPMQFERLQASDCVIYLGEIECIRDVLRECDAAVLPSYYGEGLSKFLLEAASVGLPIITTDRHGCREALIDGVTGLLVEPGDADDLAKKLEVLMRDKKLSRTMGANGRKNALHKFSVKVVVQQVLDFHREVLK